MKYRLGVCSDCGANYKVPASFEADRAKCKACGAAVEIGPVQEDAPAAQSAAAKPTPPPMPARKMAPAKPAARAPEEAKPAKQGPSMKERLMAERRAAAEAAAGASAKSSPAKPAKPAARKAGAAAGRTRSTTGADEKKPARRASSRRAAPAKSRRGGRGRGGDDDEEEAGGSRRATRRPAKPKQSPMLLMVAGVLIVGASVAAFFMLNASDDVDPGTTDEVLAGNSNEANAPVLDDVTNGTEDPTPNADEPADTTPEDTDPAADATADEGTPDTADAGVEPPTETPDTVAPTNAPAGDAAAEEKPKKKREFKDPASVDLLAIEDFGVPIGCTEERWAELVELGKVVMDPDAGGAGRRAGTKLVKEGKFAIPAILNEMKKLDLTEDSQFLTANAAQKTLTEICNGINLGWQYPNQEPDTWHYYDKKAIFNWCQLWSKFNENDPYFLEKTKRTKKAEPKPAEEEVGGEDDLDDLDDI